MAQRDPKRLIQPAATSLLIDAALLIALSATAGAVWHATTTPSSIAAARSDTLTAPTSVTAVGACQSIVLGPYVTINWTATNSSFASGYNIRRSATSGGTYTQVGTVNGRTTTSFTDTSVSSNTTYYYVVQAKHLNWTSNVSNEATALTPLLCL